MRIPFVSPRGRLGFSVEARSLARPLTQCRSGQKNDHTLLLLCIFMRIGGFAAIREAIRGEFRTALQALGCCCALAGTALPADSRPF